MRIIIRIEKDKEETEYELVDGERVVVDKNIKIEINIPWE